MRKWFKANNIKLVVDLDDRWELPWIRNHATVYNTVSRKYIVNTIQVADIVWTASNFLNREVRRVFGKKHVYTIYNGIDPRLEGWKPVKKNWSGVRFGYFGALHHDEDIAPLRGLFADKHMKTIEFDVPSDYKHIPYYEVFGGEKLTTKPLPVNKYQTLYDDIDVSIAPLANTNFNRCKSALKIMEAGFKKCAIIASDVSVYRDVVEHGKTGLLCRTRDDWKREIDGMTKEKAEDLTEAMYDVCMDNYTVSRINEVRLNSIRDYIKS
jgi:glycosyltransferase involved in cell wall biosynthesis